MYKHDQGIYIIRDINPKYTDLFLQLNSRGILLRYIEEFFKKNGKTLVTKEYPPAKNLLVDTGRELIGDILVNDIGLYSHGVYPQYIHLGTGTTVPDRDDWKLETPWGAGGIYAITAKQRVEFTVCEWDAVIASGDAGTIEELGLFLWSTAPTADPQDNPSQRQNAMLSRSLPDSPIVKLAGAVKTITYRSVF